MSRNSAIEDVMATGIESMETEYEAPAQTKPARKRDDPPYFGTPRPAKPGALPRVIDQLERATGNAKRFKVVCRNFNQNGPKPVKYILANSEDEAVKLYRKDTKLETEIAKFNKGRKAEDAEQPDIIVTALAD